MANESEEDFTWLEYTANFSVEAYLNEYLGPKHLPLDIVVPITVLYLIIFITGILGNVSVCLVIAKKSSMQTATNYYLFSLAVSDVLQLILGLPNDLWLFWQQYPWILGEVMCRTRALISEMTNYASVLTIVAFTVERYVAICHPLLSQTTSSLPRVIKIIAANWVTATVVAIPYAVLTSVYYMDFPQGSKRYIPESAFCRMSTDPKDNPHYRALLCFSSLTFFLIPMTLIGILYIKIGLTLRRSALGPNENSGLNEGKPSSRKAIIRMLVAVVIAFFLCWAPFHAQRLLFVYAEASHWPPTLRKVNEILYFAGCFYYFNATINPILYNVMSVKYRESFREVLCRSFPHLEFLKCANSNHRSNKKSNDNGWHESRMSNGVESDSCRLGSMSYSKEASDDTDCTWEDVHDFKTYFPDGDSTLKVPSPRHQSALRVSSSPHIRIPIIIKSAPESEQNCSTWRNNNILRSDVQIIIAHTNDKNSTETSV